MSGRQNKKKKSQGNKLDAISGLMGANPVFAKMLMEGMVKGFGADLLGRPEVSVSELASILSGKSPQKNGVRRAKPSAKEASRFSPEELVELLEELCNAVLKQHYSAVRRNVQAQQADVKITSIDPTELITAKVSVNGSKSQSVTLSFDHEEFLYDLNCSCRKSHCVHSFALVTEIDAQLQSTDSLILRAILGDDFVERQRLQALEQEKQKQEQQQRYLLNLLKDAERFSPLTPVSLDRVDVVEAERVVWNLSVTVDYNRPVLQLKPVRQKETKSGTWSKGREVSLKSFMEMPREGWSKTDWAIAEHTEQLNWNPYFRISDDRAFRVLEGSNAFTLDREPATLKVHSYELVVVEVKNGWKLTTSAQQIVNTWDAEGGESKAIGSPEGTVVISYKLARVAWVKTPASLRDLTKLVTMENVFFAADQKDTLLTRLTGLHGKVPLRLPESLGGEEVADETESLLLLRMKKTGSLDATVCVRDARGLLLLPGDGVLRRQETVDGQLLQFVRNGELERARCREIVSKLSIDDYPSTRDWTWQLEDPDAVVDLLSSAGQLVTENQLKIVWHQNSAKELNIIGNVSAANVSVKVSRQRDWFGVNGTCKIGDQEIQIQDLLAGLRGTTTMAGFVEVLPGQWAAIADEFRAVLQRLADVSNDNRGKLQLAASAAMALSSIEEKTLNIEADKAWKSCLAKVKSIKSINPDPPAALDCELRDYQVEGFRWMCRLSEWGVGGILADDMGLGKTVQALAVLLQRMESGPALVIAPTSLGFNWEQECIRFAPSLTAKLLRDSDRTDLIENVAEGDVVICSYGLALRETELLQTVNWGTLILDEAQNIKNSNAKTSKEIRKLKAEWKVALTGTPMENHLGELWSIFRAVSPGVLGSWEQFRKKFALPIEKDNNSERRQALSNVISPFILRRSKAEVLTDLPERNESNLLIELTPKERARYDQVRLAAVGELDQLSGDSDLSSDQRFKVLQLLTRLRQISCHVGMIDDTWNEGSSKLTMLMEKLEQLKERGHRPLIFSQFTTHLGLIKEACDAAGISYQYLDGQTTPKARQQRVEAFQNGESDAFLISLKAGGTGLNLTAADYVIHMDPWWNPAVEDQATDRAHRIGQKNSVMVYRIIAKDTIEEQILSLHDEKRDLVEGVLSGAEASARMSTEQLAELIRTGAAAALR